MSADIPAKAREKILFFLKTKGPQTAAQIAKRLA
jgi:predicted ArsR family transcriptional regulator